MFVFHSIRFQYREKKITKRVLAWPFCLFSVPEEIRTSEKLYTYALVHG